MADTVPAAPVKKAKKTAPKAKKAPASHPKYSDMVSAALSALKERKGSSRHAIVKYIAANYKVDEKSAMIHVKMALKRGVASGSLKQVKGTGASGSFKLAKEEPKEKKPKAKKAVKKPAAAKKSTPKKVAKKPAAKKTPKKAAKKPAAKKSPAKKPKVAKKSSAKKPTPKKASKPKKTAKK